MAAECPQNAGLVLMEAAVQDSLLTSSASQSFMLIIVVLHHEFSVSKALPPLFAPGIHAPIYFKATKALSLSDFCIERPYNFAYLPLDLACTLHDRHELRKNMILILMQGLRGLQQASYTRVSGVAEDNHNFQIDVKVDHSFNLTL